MPPKRTNLILTSNIPYSERDVFILNSLDVESDCWDGSDDLTKLQLVQYGCLTSGIKTNHQYTHFLLAKKAGKEPGH